ncbi:uncharacterized protein METZ01_LOCUS349732, partial [marine metagenome]
MAQSGAEFNAIRISLASPEQIRAWSYGEVTKPETINYRTLRPERDGLFCERIFGPSKDWECACGKYRKIRFKGIKCERCGVEVTRAKVRRERMGNIELAAPVAHIWFSKGIPSRLGLLLDLSPRNLERVLYFAQYIITEVDIVSRDLAIQELEEQHNNGMRLLRERAVTQEADPPAEELPNTSAESTDEESSTDKGPSLSEREAILEEAFQSQLDDLHEIQPMKLLVEARHRELSDRYPNLFKSGMGAEAILAILKNLDLDGEREFLAMEMHSTSGQRRKKAVKRLRLVEAFRKSTNLPEWMVLSVLPVLPPDLR